MAEAKAAIEGADGKKLLDQTISVDFAFVRPPPKQGGAPREPAPALRAKGIETEAPPLTYTGPAEDGSAQVRGNGADSSSGGGTRRERREAARRQGRHAKAKRR